MTFLSRLPTVCASLPMRRPVPQTNRIKAPGARTLLAVLLMASAVGAPRLHAFSYIEESAGRLSFPADAEGYRIPDFSHAGYRGSNDPLPSFGTEYVTKVALNNPSGDETARIQNAIKTVSALPLNQHGYRGAVTLGAGTWNISSLVIDADGVVLRGAGASSTILTSGAPLPGQTLRIGASSSKATTEAFADGRTGKQWNITDSVVHVGESTFSIADGHTLRVGDRIVIEHPATAAWLKAVQMGGSPDSGDHWGVGTVPIRYLREVTAVKGTSITIDAPVMYSLVRSRSQSFVFKYTGSLRRNIGVENLTVDHKTKSTVDSNHANDCIRFNRVEDSWARNVITTNFKRAGFYLGETVRVTLDNCQANDPHAPITSAMRYGFLGNASQLVLFKDCYGRRSRHTFVTNGHAMDSGNVYLRCVAEDNYAASESGHQRWASGHLWDGCEFRHKGKPEANAKFGTMMLWLGNHGNNSNGHGWSAVTNVAYRTKVDSPGHAIVAEPPTGKNFAIACVGDWRSNHHAHGDYPGALNIATRGSLPSSLFAAQLAQRRNPSSPDLVPPTAPTGLAGAAP